ncbi:MAG: YkvA family protein [Hyphomicrobiales bacterium]
MDFGRTASWFRLKSDPARDETMVQHAFWAKARRFAARLPFAEDLLAAYYCAFDRETPFQVKAALIGALAYFVMPFDAVPDFLPVLGFTDDAAVLATAIKLVSDHILPAHRDAAREWLQDLKSKT